MNIQQLIKLFDTLVSGRALVFKVEGIHSASVLEVAKGGKYVVNGAKYLPLTKQQLIDRYGTNVLEFIKHSST